MISAAVVERTELAQMPVRLLQVPADRLVVLDRLPDPALEPVGEAAVQLGARALQEPAIGGVADQHVMEAQHRLAQEPAGVGLDQLAPPERLEPGVEVADPAGQQLGDGGARELPSDHGGALEHGALLGCEALEAGGEKRVDGGRHLEGGELDGRRPPIPSRLSAPSWTSIRTSSPTKSGLPSLVASTRPAIAAGSSSAPMTFAASRVAALASSPASVTTSATRPPGTASAERTSRSSGAPPPAPTAARRCSTAPGAR